MAARPVRAGSRSLVPIFAYGAIVLLLILQTVWLLPYLDVRAEQVIAGIAPPFSSLHLVYIAVEAVKFLLLVGLGISMVRLHLGKNEQDR